MSDMTDFLMARIAEDENLAHEAAVKRGPVITPTKVSGVWLNSRYHMTIDPARALTECEAKRRIVDEHRLITDRDRLVKVWRDPTPGVACERCAGDPLGDRPLEDIGPCDTLLFVAAIYADHPDYREEWKP